MGTNDPSDLVEAAKRAAEGGRDPYPILERLLADSQSCLTPDGHAYVYGYAPATAVLRSPAFFKGGEHVSSTSPLFTAEQVEMLRRERPETPGMLSSIDDPDHARLRRLVGSAFRPTAVAQLRELAGRVMDDVLDKLDRREPVELLGTLATEVPSQVVGALIGLPLADRGMFAELAAISSVGRDPDVSFDDQLRAVRARRRMHEYVAGMVEEERRSPGDTLVGRLLRLEAEGEVVSDAEVISLITLMHSAGFGTTRRVLGNGLVALLRHPEQADALRSDPDLTRPATEEVLRFDTSVMTVSYWAGEGAEVDGVAVEPGKLCTVILGAANHDHRVFEDASAFDITRARSSAPLSFGFGAHYCLGAALAKMEGDVVLGEMVRRFPRMELTADPRRAPMFRSRTFEEVWVRLDPHPA